MPCSARESPPGRTRGSYGGSSRRVGQLAEQVVEELALCYGRFTRANGRRLLAGGAARLARESADAGRHRQAREVRGPGHPDPVDCRFLASPRRLQTRILFQRHVVQPVRRPGELGHREGGRQSRLGVQIDTELLEQLDPGVPYARARPEQSDLGASDTDFGLLHVDRVSGSYLLPAPGKAKVQLRPGQLLPGQGQPLDLSQHLKVRSGYGEPQRGLGGADLGMDGVPVSPGLARSHQRPAVHGKADPDVVGAEIVRRLVLEPQLFRGDASETLLPGALPGNAGAGGGRGQPRPVGRFERPVGDRDVVARRLQARVVAERDIEGLREREGGRYALLGFSGCG